MGAVQGGQQADGACILYPMTYCAPLNDNLPWETHTKNEQLTWNETPP